MTRWRHGADRGGFSILEVVVALIVFQVGVLGVAGLVLTGQNSMRRARSILRGTLEATRIGDSVLAAGGDAQGRVSRPWGSLSWAGTETGAVRVVALSAGGGDTLAVVLLWPRLEVPAAWVEPLVGPGGEAP
jgi:Tfp pilus assembly protein PilV